MNQAVELSLPRDDRVGLDKAPLQRAFLDNLYYAQGKFPALATKHDYCMALAWTVRNRLLQRWIDTAETYTREGSRTVLGIAYDRPILGYRNHTANTLRPWKAEAPESFDLSTFNRGDYDGAVQQKVASENITKVLYPNDEQIQGKELRLEQQFFFVSCALQDMLRIMRVLPHHLEIIHALNARFLDEIRLRFLGDSARLVRLALFNEHGERSMRIANLACIGTRPSSHRFRRRCFPFRGWMAKWLQRPRIAELGA